MSGRRLRWWREVAYVAAFYAVYSFIRNTGAEASKDVAYEHAREIIDVERWMGLYFEESLQDVFIDAEWFIRFWNIFYGTFHFIVTAGALIWMFRRRPDRYPLWRNTLAVTTALALIGFALYPLMPPRLLDHCGPFGACDTYGYVDTLAEIGGLWSFDSGAMAKVSNQYAAMPSLHFGWSTWCVCVLLPMVRRRWVKALVVAYPALTLFAIVVTANHYWIDAAGGAVVLGAGYLAARLFTETRPPVGAGSEQRVAAVDEDRVAGVVARQGTGEVDGDAAEVSGLAPSPHGDPR